MPLFMDIHRNVEGLTDQAIAEAHRKDLEVQDQHGAKNVGYWYNPAEGTVFCLFEAPDAESAKAVHRDSHGMMPSEVIEVTAGH